MIRSPGAVEGGVPLGIWLAVPAYTGFIHVETAHCINFETYEALNQKIPFLTTFHEEDPIISRCRNSMIANFLASDPKKFTDMIFLDADVGFAPGTLIKLAKYPVDIVGAVYPFRRDPIGFPVQFLQDRTPNAETGLIEVAGLPAGCMRISRRALTTMIEKFPGLEYAEDNVPQGKTWALFDFVRRNGIFCGEDYVFCAIAKEAGFPIWCDPDNEMQHVGHKKFMGHLGSYLKAQEAPTPEQAMANIIAFNERMQAKQNQNKVVAA